MSQVFISHIDTDADVALQVARLLESRGHTTWVYAMDAVPGEPHLLETGQAIEACRMVVLVVSRAALRSHQLEHDIRRANKGGKRFFPLLRDIRHDEVRSQAPAWVAAIGPAVPTHYNANDLMGLGTRLEAALTSLRVVPRGVLEVRLQDLDRALSRYAEGAGRPAEVSSPSSDTTSPTPHPDRASDTSKASAEVFISAKSEDSSQALEVYRFLTDKGVPAFLSEVSLPKLRRSNYREQIDRALDAAPHMVVVTTSAANVTSGWVEAEWGFFINELRAHRKTGNLVTMIAGSIRREELPPSLRYYEVLPLDARGLERMLQYVGDAASTVRDLDSTTRS